MVVSIATENFCIGQSLLSTCPDGRRVNMEAQLELLVQRRWAELICEHRQLCIQLSQLLLIVHHKSFLGCHDVLSVLLSCCIHTIGKVICHATK